MQDLKPVRSDGGEDGQGTTFVGWGVELTGAAKGWSWMVWRLGSAGESGRHSTQRTGSRRHWQQKQS
jgi:hypothetical protein